MVINLSNQPADPRKAAVLVSTKPRFGAGPGKVIAQPAEKIANLQTAEKLKSMLRTLGLNKDIRVGGLSLEDVSGRLQTLIGVYLLQGYYAAKDNKHPIETNGRNAVVWLMTLLLTSWSKSENFGVNTLLLNPIMKKKGTRLQMPFVQPLLEKISKEKTDKYFQGKLMDKVIQPVVDKMRMDVDYLEILEKAGIKPNDKEKLAAMQGKSALWASSWLDTNRVEQIDNLRKSLGEKLQSAGKGKDVAADKLIHDAIPKFFKRINAFNIASTALITAATVYFIGGVAMKIVNKVFTPLDKNDPPTGKPPATPPAAAPVRPGYPAAPALAGASSVSAKPFAPSALTPFSRPPLLPQTSSNGYMPPLLQAMPSNRQGGLN